MTGPRTYTDYLQDIADALAKSQQFIVGYTFEQFQQDDKTVFAVVRALEVVGEAAKQLPQSLCDQHPDVPWRAVTGMRDKLIHHYFGVDLLVVWRTVTEDVPFLRATIERILNQSK